MTSITYCLNRNATLHGNKIALVCGERRRTWIELRDRVSRAGAALRQLGIAKGDRLAVLMLNQDRYVELYYAAAWIGAAIVPLNIRWSNAENEDALRDCRANALVVDNAFERAGVELARRVPDLTVVHAGEKAPAAEHAALIRYEEMLSQSVPMPDAEAAEFDLAGIFYTGGTTGRSKGAMLSHRNLLSNARNMLPEFSGQENVIALLIAPVFHIIACSAIFTNSLASATLVMDASFSPEGFGRTVAHHKVTHSALVPTMIQMLLDSPHFKPTDYASLVRITYGGSPMNESLIDRAASSLPHVEFVQGYGMTELSPIITLLRWKDHLGEQRAKGRHRSAGRPIPAVEVRIVDQNGASLPPGKCGEIVVRSDTVMMGYWERPEETQKAVVDGWMHTGDGGYMDDDGYVFIVDRIKDMIVTGGENVYSVEVENCIAQHPHVQQCAVIGIPDPRWGEAVHAVIMRRPGTNLSDEDVVAFCRDKIANYKCPRSVDIRDEPLPLSGAGKILKRSLRQPFWIGASRQVS